MTPVEYSKALISKHGSIEAKRIAEQALNFSKTGTITLYDDTEWSFGSKGLEMSKTNRKGNAKEKRESKTTKFWLNVLCNIK